MSHLTRGTLILALTVAISTNADASGLYTILDLGTLPGTSQSVATGINGLGQVVGYSNNPSDGRDGNPRPFLYSNGQMTSITPIGGGIPNGINDSGMVVGGIYQAVNNSGQYIGPAYGGGGNLIGAGGTTSLGSFQPMGLNDSGVIVGQIPNAFNGFDPAIYRNGVVTDLTKLLNLDTLSGQALQVNKSGDVFFYYLDLKHDDQPNYMILKANGQLVPAFYSAAMNNSDQLVGNYFFENGHFSQLTDLLVPSSQSSVWEFLRATAINDAGQIVGVGELKNGVDHAFLMSPLSTPEPASIIILATGMAALLVSQMSRKRK